MKFLLVLFCFLSFLLTYAQQTNTNQRYSTFTIDAPQLKTKKKIWVYLPEEYDKTTKKYPVIYMHDGQNLFDAKTSYVGEWNVDETLDSIKAKVIVIGIEHGGDKRIEELTPFPHVKYGGGKADEYLDFLVNTLKPHVDKTYRTKTSAKNTAIFGSSLGGLISFYASIKYPKVFGKVGCFSPAFWFNRKELNELMTKTEDYKTKIYFLCGDNEGDADVIPDMENVIQWVNSKRCECKKLNKKVIIKGGQHNEKLWRENFKNAYLWLF
ncbi:alpha/beta hydrolase [Flavobacterium dankookense]|uniref:Putative alpha/beta superfamily hydrolase n=1 Tax=Flavobacterium dankookense TaxID=706186 RepID=A0A4R6Q4T6_9FLAO|nr:alpha/beta hydrolase-fold protein [Flavobacterium dankookense]TDP57374.1 putative alpha/beta superfamily hydrolase [Flavobacterium dankookense]